MTRSGGPGRIAAAIAAAAVLLLVLPLSATLFALDAILGSETTTCQGPGGRTTTGGPTLAPNADQAAFAQMITSIVAGRGLPQQAAVVAIATAAQESRLGQVGMNVAVDHDSLGLFQQRPSAGWGSPAQVKDPAYATNTFLDHLVRVGNWLTLPVTVAAQTVQGSAFPSAYAKWQSLAASLAQRFWPAGTPLDGDPAAATTPSAPGAGAIAASAAGSQPCPGEGGDGAASGGSSGATSPPPGFTPPTEPQLAAAVDTAVAQLGKPYQWGGVGPDAFDCSGLMLTAWRAAGVTLPRVAAAQSRFGAPVVGLAQAQPGDLVFIAGADGSAAAPGHVGMYVGDDRIVDAPDVGKSIEIIPATKWQGKITGIRRPGVTHPDPPASASDRAL